jgi:hypothetical protein
MWTYGVALEGINGEIAHRAVAALLVIELGRKHRLGAVPGMSPSGSAWFRRQAGPVVPPRWRAERLASRSWPDDAYGDGPSGRSA